MYIFTSIDASGQLYTLYIEQQKKVHTKKRTKIAHSNKQNFIRTFYSIFHFVMLYTIFVRLRTETDLNWSKHIEKTAEKKKEINFANKANFVRIQNGQKVYKISFWFWNIKWTNMMRLMFYQFNFGNETILALFQLNFDVWSTENKSRQFTLQDLWFSVHSNQTKKLIKTGIVSIA